MPDIELDSLSFEVEAISKGAVSSLNSLGNAFEKLSEKLNSLDSIKGAMDSLKNATQALRDFSDLSASISAAGDSAREFANGFSRLLTVMGNTDRVENAQKGFKSLNDSLTELGSTIQNNGLSDAFSGIADATKTAASVKEVKKLEESTAQAGQRATGARSQYADLGYTLQSIFGIPIRTTNTLARAIEKLGTSGKQSGQEVSKSMKEMQQAAINTNKSFQDLESSAKDISSQPIINSQESSNAQALSNSLGGLKGAASSAGTAISGMSKALAAAAPYIAAIGIALKALKSAIEIVVKVAKLLYNAFKQVTKVLFEAGKAAAQFVAKHTGLDKILKSNADGVGVLQKALNKLWNIIQIKVIRSLVNDLFTGVSEGFQQLARESTTFNSAMSSITSSTTTLKNALSAALAPAIIALAPIITTLTQLFINLFNAIAMVSAALFGQASAFQAINVWEDFAAGMDNASGSAKALRENLNMLPLDQLHLISDATTGNGGGGGGGGTSTGNMFEEAGIPDWIAELVKDPYELGKYIGTWLDDALNSIDWASIQKKVRQIAEGIADFLNGLLQGLKPETFGRTIAEGLNTAVQFAYVLLQKFDFNYLGEWLGRAANTSIADFDWALLGSTFALGINGAINTALVFIRTFNFSEFAISIADGIAAFTRDTEWDNLSFAIIEGISGVSRFIIDFFGTFALYDLALNLIDSLAYSLKNTDWVEVGQAVGAIIRFISETGLYFIRTIKVSDIKNAWEQLWYGAEEEIQGSLSEFLSELTVWGMQLLAALLKPAYEKYLRPVLRFILGGWIVDLTLAASETVGIAELAMLEIELNGRKFANSLIDFAKEVEEENKKSANNISKDQEESWKSSGESADDYASNLKNNVYKDIDADTKETAKMLEDEFGDSWESVLQDAKDAVKDIDDGALSDLGLDVEDLSLDMIRYFAESWDDIQITFQEIAPFFTINVAEPIENAFRLLMEHLGGLGEDIAESMKNTFNIIIGYINGMLGGATTAINFVAKSLSSLSVSFPDWVPDVGGKSFNVDTKSVTAPHIPSLAIGIDDVPYDTLAYIHKGEAVIPEQANTILQAFGGVSGMLSQIIGARQNSGAFAVGYTGFDPINTPGRTQTSTRINNGSGREFIETLSSRMINAINNMPSPRLYIGDKEVWQSSQRGSKSSGISIGGNFATSL